MGSPRRRETGSSFRFLTEECPDGFRDESPDWSAFCPDRRVKRSLEEHEHCSHFGGMTRDQHGNVIAFRCALGKE